jgi:glycosyltransferase involved in cell wall biosynthesis
VVHARTRDELLQVFPDDRERITFIADTWLNVALWKIESALPVPAKVREFTVGWLARLYTQLRARKIIRSLVREQGIQVIHQPIPVSPRETSVIHGLGVPVAIGPMNGGMSYPPGFRVVGRGASGAGARRWLALARSLSNAMHWLIPGKRKAELLLVANERTRRSLPSRVRGRVVEVVENGVDLSLWAPRGPDRDPGAPTRFVFSGRLVDWKAVDLLLNAFQRVVEQVPATLDILGDGPERGRLEGMAARMGLESRVRFLGWQPQARLGEVLRSSDALVLPSLQECGGAVVLEAMASALPVIATDWGGPADYIDDSCGILVRPTDPDAFVAGLVDAMVRLARSPELRRAMGLHGRSRVVAEFDWERKVDRVLGLLEEIAEPSRRDPM